MYGAEELNFFNVFIPKYRYLSKILYIDKDFAYMLV